MHGNNVGTYRRKSSHTPWRSDNSSSPALKYRSAMFLSVVIVVPMRSANSSISFLFVDAAYTKPIRPWISLINSKQDGKNVHQQSPA